jgi:hypothetical protein
LVWLLGQRSWPHTGAPCFKGVVFHGHAVDARRRYNETVVAEAADPFPSTRRGQDRRTMGIKFRCPNGHKLNVKEIDPATGRRVVGRVGYCPKCGARFRIPPGSQAVPEMSDSSVLDDPAPLTAPDDSGTLVPAHLPPGVDGIRASTVGMRPAAEPALKTPGVSRPLSVSAHESHSKEGAATSAPPVSAAAPKRWPAIDEAPEAIWYVRPPTGGQYGPARGDVMRQWLLEGRVPEDALVWREGWPDWASAGSVFPGLVELFAAPQVATGSRGASPAPPQPAVGAARVAAVPQAGSASASRRTVARLASPAPRGQRGWRVVGVLAGLCVALGAVLAYLLIRS